MKNMHSLIQNLGHELPRTRVRAIEDLTEAALEIVWKIKERVGDSNLRVERAAAAALTQIAEAASVWIVDGRGEREGSAP